MPSERLEAHLVDEFGRGGTGGVRIWQYRQAVTRAGFDCGALQRRAGEMRDDAARLTRARGRHSAGWASPLPIQDCPVHIKHHSGLLLTWAAFAGNRR